MRLSRRRLLSLLGASAVALPYAGMLRRRALAQSTAPTRFVAIFSPHGCAHELYRPRGSATTDAATRDDFSFDFANAHLGPLQAWRDQLIVLDGLDFRANYESGGFGGHEVGISTCLTGGTRTGSHESIDQFIARRLDRPMRSIELGVGIQSQAGPDAWDLVTMCWDQRGHGVENIVDPGLAFDRLFADFAAPDDGGSDDDERARQARRRRAAFETSLASAQRLERELRGAEREKLQAHVDALQSITRSISTMPMPSAPGCTVEARPSVMASAHDAALDVQIALLAQTFACDVTRVASLQMHYAGHSHAAPWMTEFPGFRGGDFHFDLHNNVAHRVGESMDDDVRVSQIGQYHAQKLADLLALLDVPDPLGDGETILDNTVIYWTNELGNPAAHHNVGVPTVIAGGGGGRLQRGQYIKVRDGHPGWNEFDALFPHNRALTTVCRAMGFEDVGYFGNDDFRDASPYLGPIDDALV